MLLEIIDWFAAAAMKKKSMIIQVTEIDGMKSITLEMKELAEEGSIGKLI